MSFNLLPDDNLGPGSESMMVGQLPGPGGTQTAVALDFTAGQTVNDPPFFTVLRSTANPQIFSLLDLRLVAEDPNLGASVVLERDPLQAGSLTTTGTGGALSGGAQLSLTFPILLSWQGSGIGPGLPATGVLSLSGTLTPGYYHVVSLLQGGIDTLPLVSVSLQVKPDFFPPNVTWQMISDSNLSGAVRSGGSLPDTLSGGLVLIRDPQDYRAYTLGPVSLEIAGTPPVLLTAAAGLGGSLFLDPATGTVSGTLTWEEDGLAVTWPVDGVGDAFEGPCSTPAGLTLQESGLPGAIADIALHLRRAELVPAGSAAVLGQVYQPLLRGWPGVVYAYGASLDAAPGFNTPVGDIPLEADWLFDFSRDPFNGIFLGVDGTMPPTGELRVDIVVPNEPVLQGFTFFLGALIFDGVEAAGFAVTNPHRVVL